MDRLTHIEPMPSMLGFTNPESTEHASALARIGHVQAQLLETCADVTVIDHAASPLDLLLVQEDQTLIYSDGGDGTVRSVIAAMTGIVPNDPERTAQNFAHHQSISEHLRYFAGAGGNANNWPLSAHGQYAVHPEKLPHASVQLGYHRPIMYEITDEHGDIVRSHIATSGIGLGTAAIAAYRLEKAKPELQEKGNIRRLLGETAIVLDAAREASPFAVELSATASDSLETQRLTDVTGLEFIKTKIYAKQGRTRVNIDDTNWQPLITHRYSNKVQDNLGLISTFARLKFGRNALPAEDFSNQEMSIRVDGDEPVPYHADGETDVDALVYPGQTMRLRLARIAIPTLMAT